MLFYSLYELVAEYFIIGWFMVFNATFNKIAVLIRGGQF